MNSYKRKWLGLLLVFAMVLTVLTPATTAEAAASYKTYTNGYGKAGCTTNITGLKQLLKSDSHVYAYVKNLTKERTYSIPEGDYSDLRLRVNAPKSVVWNSGTFKIVKISDLDGQMGWHEYAKGNSFSVVDDDVKMYVEKDAAVDRLYFKADEGKVNLSVRGDVRKTGFYGDNMDADISLSTGSVKELRVASEGGNIDVNARKESSVDTVKIVKDADVEIKADTDVKEIVLDSKADVTITGNAEKIEVTVTEKAEGAKVETSVPVEVNAGAKVELTLNDGAEGTTVTKADEKVEVAVDNNTSADVVIGTEGSDKTETVESGSDTATGGGTTTGGGYVPPVTPPVDPDPTPAEYTVKFDTDGGSAVADAKVKDGEKVAKPADPTKTGFKFVGWFLNDAAYNFDTPVTGNMTLVAKWTEDTTGEPDVEEVTVTFMNDGAVVKAVLVASGSAIATSDVPVVTKDGFNFAGWTLDGKAYELSTPVTKDITLEATWTEKPAENIPVIGVTLSATTLTLTVDDLENGTATLVAAVTPSNATNKNVTWTNSNPEYATFDEATGTVTAVAAGETTITVTTEDGNHTATCVVTVDPAGPVVPEWVPSVEPAPLVDHSDSPISDIATDVNAVLAGTTITLTATNLKSHTNAEDTVGYWLGFGIEMPAVVDYSKIECAWDDATMMNVSMTTPDFEKDGKGYFSAYVNMTGDGTANHTKFSITFDGVTTYTYELKVTDVTLYVPEVPPLTEGEVSFAFPEGVTSTGDGLSNDENLLASAWGLTPNGLVLSGQVTQWKLADEGKAEFPVFVKIPLASTEYTKFELSRAGEESFTSFDKNNATDVAAWKGWIEQGADATWFKFGYRFATGEIINWTKEANKTFTLNVYNGEQPVGTMTFTVNTDGVSIQEFDGVARKSSTATTIHTDLSAALSEALAGDELTVYSDQGVSNTTYQNYDINKAVTIKAANGAKIYGTLTALVDGVTLDGLTISNSGESGAQKAAVNIVADSGTVTNCTFNMPNEAPLPGGGVANGLSIWPRTPGDHTYTISGNNFIGYNISTTDKAWGSTAFAVWEGFDLSRFGLADTKSATGVTITDEDTIAAGQTYENCNNEYIHTDWTSGSSKYIYSYCQDGISNATLWEGGAENGKMVLVATTPLNLATATTYREYPANVTIVLKSGSFTLGDGTSENQTNLTFTIKGNLTVETGATLEIPSGSKIVVAGTYTNNGTVTGDGTVEEASAPQQ